MLVIENTTSLVFAIMMGSEYVILKLTLICLGLVLHVDRQIPASNHISTVWCLSQEKTKYSINDLLSERERMIKF